MSVFLIIFLLFSILALLSIIFTTLRYGIGPTPTSPKVLKAFFDILPKEIEGTVYELGAGIGTLAFPLADRYPKARVIAVEVSPLPWLFMTIKQFFVQKKNLEIRRKDFFKLSLEESRLIVCYLYPGAMKELEEKIQKECKQVFIATHTFAMPSWEPIQKSFAQDIYRTPIYLYEVKR